MIINELFSTKSEIKVVTNVADEFETVTSLDGEQYFFLATYLKRRDGEYWGVCFGTNAYVRFNLTNKRIPTKVLSFVMDSMKMFIDKYDPVLIKFSGDEGREYVYQRMLHRYVRTYDVTSTSKYGGLQFTLTKK